MKNLLRIISKYHLLLLFIVLETISFAMLFNHNSYHRSAYLNATSTITGTINKRIQYIKDFLILVESNKHLAAENASIKNSLRSSYKQNRISFHEIFDSIYSEHWHYTDCKIVYNSTNRQNNIIIIDKGIMQGVEPETAIISGRGVVGIVQHVSNHYSTAYSLLNTNVIISAKLKSTGHFGTLRWDGNDPSYCMLSDIPNHVKVENGDTIVTSGYSALFPEGITIGIATNIDKSVDLSFYQIKVKLCEDFGALTHAYTVKNILKHEIDSLKKIIEND